jgi:hypothetical protein
MRDIINGTDLGLQHNWDNDPCRKTVDQKYNVKVSYEKNLEGMNESLRAKAEQLETLGFGVEANVQLTAQREYTSPLKCLEFVNQVEASGFTAEIEERRFSATDDPYWQELSKDDLEKVLSRERTPAYRLTGGYNSNFSPSVDIGD